MRIGGVRVLVMMTVLFGILSCFVIPFQAMGAALVGAFSSEGLAGWDDKLFRDATDYALVTEEGRTVLKAHSVKSASAKIYKIEANAQETPFLRWSWKVERSLAREDVTRKQGDDFAARVYVVFPRTFLWQTRAINYVWAAKMPKGGISPSPYTDHNQLVAVETGDVQAGQWKSEERNIYEDYLRIFHEEPPNVGAIAVMTDTDDTQDEVSAWYGDISLSQQ
jgi:hypothetical protein